MKRTVPCVFLLWVCHQLAMAQTSNQALARDDAVNIGGKPGSNLREEAAMTPEVIGAFSSVRGEQFPSHGEDACRYTFNVKSAHCESNDVKMKMTEIQQAFLAVEQRLTDQGRRLEQAERLIARINAHIFPAEQTITTTERSTSAPPNTDPSQALVNLSEVVQSGISQLETQIHESEKRESGFEAEIANLTAILRATRGEMSLIRRQNEQKDSELVQKRQELARIRAEVVELRRSQGSKRMCQRRPIMMGRYNRLQRERNKLTLERLANATAQINQLRALVTSQAQNTSSQVVPCNNRSTPGFLNESMESENVTTCGRLVSISEPITFRESASYLGEIGAWMQDPVVGGEQIYVIKIIGENQVRKLFEYANMADFRNHRNEVVRIVPDAMESNGAVVYNGSLYYQRRNSRKIVRYHISTQQVLRQRPIKQAAFHGAQAYQWGGYSDIDLTVDETGLWVIYSLTKGRGNIVVSKINPITLRPIRPIIKTPIPKRGVANAFIICQVLYTVNSFSDANAYINFSYNLNTRTRQKLKIPFINLYRQNVMIDYNPLNRHIYSWDNGYQVAYKSKVDDSFGQLVGRRILPWNSTHS